jgi:hypothetical protein
VTLDELARILERTEDHDLRDYDGRRLTPVPILAGQAAMPYKTLGLRLVRWGFAYSSFIATFSI